MPGAGGKSTAGFTKSANKQKYVRNRDLKLTEREQKAEENIKQKMGDGICPKCREKLQWRFQYNKYKPLKSLANCRKCRNKCITKAYRTYCDNCASQLHVCPGCCTDMNSALQSKKERDEYLGLVDENGNDDMQEQDSACSSSTGRKRLASDSAPRQGRVAGSGQKAAAVAKVSTQGVDSDDDMQAGSELGDYSDDGADEECCGDTSRRRVAYEDTLNSSSIAGSESVRNTAADSLPQTSLAMASQWDAHKFENMAYSKYSKSRVVGSVEDTVYSFGCSSSSSKPPQEEHVYSSTGTVDVNIQQCVGDELSTGSIQQVHQKEDGMMG